MEVQTRALAEAKATATWVTKLKTSDRILDWDATCGSRNCRIDDDETKSVPLDLWANDEHDGFDGFNEFTCVSLFSIEDVEYTQIMEQIQFIS